MVDNMKKKLELVFGALFAVSTIRIILFLTNEVFLTGLLKTSQYIKLVY